MADDRLEHQTRRIHPGATSQRRLLIGISCRRTGAVDDDEIGLRQQIPQRGQRHHQRPAIAETRFMRSIGRSHASHQAPGGAATPHPDRSSALGRCETVGARTGSGLAAQDAHVAEAGKQEGMQRTVRRHREAMLADPGLHRIRHRQQGEQPRRTGGDDGHARPARDAERPRHHRRQGIRQRRHQMAGTTIQGGDEPFHIALAGADAEGRQAIGCGHSTPCLLRHRHGQGAEIAAEPGIDAADPAEPRITDQGGSTGPRRGEGGDGIAGAGQDRGRRQAHRTVTTDASGQHGAGCSDGTAEDNGKDPAAEAGIARLRSLPGRGAWCPARRNTCSVRDGSSAPCRNARI